MRLPLIDQNDQGSIDYEETCKMFDYFLDNGYTYFDTAYFYHDYKGEVALRECLVKRHPRDSFTITTKLFLGKPKTIEEAEAMFNEQLEKIGVDYFDYYWLHAVKRDRIDLINELHLFDFIEKKKEAGIVKHIGFSFHDTPEVLEELLKEHPSVEYVQLQLNYLDWDSYAVQSRKCYEICQKYGKKVVVMEPVKGGKLAELPKEAEDNFKAYNAEVSNASWALRFAASLDDVYMVLSGMSNLQQTMDNVKTFNDFVALNDEEKEIIEKNVEIIKKKNKIACTACHYCTESCPMNIAIPEYFDLINNEISSKTKYEDFSKAGFGKASDCLKCGACEDACPQNLPIRDYLENEVVKRFED